MNKTKVNSTITRNIHYYNGEAFEINGSKVNVDNSLSLVTMKMLQ